MVYRYVRASKQGHCQFDPNMQDNPTIKGHSLLAKQKSIANETLLFFVPMAKQLGMSAMAEELEELCLKVLGG